VQLIHVQYPLETVSVLLRCCHRVTSLEVYQAVLLSLLLCTHIIALLLHSTVSSCALLSELPLAVIHCHSFSCLSPQHHLHCLCTPLLPCCITSTSQHIKLPVCYWAFCCAPALLHCSCITQHQVVSFCYHNCTILHDEQACKWQSGTLLLTWVVALVVTRE
jgi:hypothetical protein